MAKSREIRCHITPSNFNRCIQMTDEQRSSSPVEVDQDGPTKRARTTPTPKKAIKNAGTCSMDKKQIGDRVKAALALN